MEAITRARVQGPGWGSLARRSQEGARWGGLDSGYVRGRVISVRVQRGFQTAPKQNSLLVANEGMA